MMHTHEELVKINGTKLYTMDYVQKHNIPKATKYGEEGWCRCYGLGTDKGTKNIHTAEGVKVVYTYGEKTWFDTQEERDNYRAMRNAERVKETKKNKTLAAITEKLKMLSNDDLEKILATL